MRAPMGIPLAVVLVSLFTFFSPARAQQITLTPSISVSETYDDNIYLDPQNEQSDYITAVSPGIALDMKKSRSELVLSYVPSFVFYGKNSEENTTRHLGNITYRQDIEQHWKFQLTDTYVRSEEPLETTEGIETIRRTRNPYQRNTGEARMTYLFGPEDTFTAGYRNDLLINEDPAIEDGTIHEPFIDLTRWFDKWNGMGLSYRYSVGEFSRDDGNINESDYTGHDPAIRYMHRWSQQLSGFVSYAYSTRDFDQSSTFREDYDVHTAMIGGEKQFSPQSSLSAEVGYFIQEADRSENENGLSYRVMYRQGYQRARFLVGVSGGWDEQYLEAENTGGFVEYRSVEARGEYRFLENLSGYAGARYREDMYQQVDVDTQTWFANAGIRWAFHRYVSLVFNYTYITRDNDDPSGEFYEEYKVNRYMVMLTGSKPYVWQ